MRLPRSADSSEPLPVLTATVMAACVVIFLGILVTAPQMGLNAAMERFGFGTASRVWEGDYRSLVSNTLIHYELWHIGFNLYWFWLLGSILERAIGQARWLAFFFGAAVVSSAIQLGVGGTGHGLSGVGYALFGFGWMARPSIDGFRRILTDQVVRAFLIWGVGCLIATQLGFVHIGNGAHFGGLLFGVILGAMYAKRRRPALLVPALVLTLAAAAVPVFWAPWTSEWNAKQAADAYNRRDYTAAIPYFRRALALGESKEWCWEWLARSYAILNDRPHFEEALNQLRGENSQKADELKGLMPFPDTSE